MTVMQQVVYRQENGEAIVNENFETLEHQAVYGKDHENTSGLTWGYYGGRWGGFAITAGTLSLTASNTNYVVVAIASGVISVSTSNTNWNNDTDYVRVYKITTGASTVSATEDHRAGPGGVHGGGGGGAGAGGDASTNTATSVVGEVALFADASGKLLKRATGSGLVRLTSGVQSTSTVATADIDADAVTNAKLANVSQWTLKGRVSSGSGDPEDLTYNQARQLLNKKQALTDGTTISWDADLGVNARVTLGGNRTLANPTNLVDGDVLNLRIIQDGTGSRTLAYGSKWKFPGGSTPVLSTAAGTVDFLSAQYDSTADTLVAVLNKAFA